MKIAVLESIIMPAGHEVEFDRILVDELKALGHEPRFFVPERFPFKLDYGVPVDYLHGGEAVTYAGVGALKKLWLSVQREARRVRWFDDAYEKAKTGVCDAIIIPTSTYRYLRTVRKTKLKDSPVPVLFIVHGINPGEKDKFLREAERCKKYKQLHFAVLTLRNDFIGVTLPNLHMIVPPVFTPRDLGVQPSFTVHSPLRLGFFGQYRREKNLAFFLDAFVQAKFTAPVELLVQGATAKPEDSADFERLAKAYEEHKSISFWHKNLIGREWQQALLDSDVILMPYAAERYRYHWGAMLFTAIGYYKPVLQSPELNPEVLAQYCVGEAVELDSVEQFAGQLERFVNRFADRQAEYQQGLEAANREYNPTLFIERLLAVLK